MYPFYLGIDLHLKRTYMVLTPKSLATKIFLIEEFLYTLFNTANYIYCLEV